MATKKEGTPDGIICSCCGQDKTPYNYFNGKRGREMRYFITNPAWSTTRCFQCNGDYRCLGCGVVQDASQFRVGGRFCQSCKDAGIYLVSAEVYARKAEEPSGDTFDAENAPESGAFE